MSGDGVAVRVETALDKFNKNADLLKDETPLERLRYFLSHALNGQDWLDVEPFLDALAAGVAPTAPAQPHDWEEHPTHFKCRRCGLVSQSGMEQACPAGVTPPLTDDRISNHEQPLRQDNAPARDGGADRASHRGGELRHGATEPDGAVGVDDGRQGAARAHDAGGSSAVPAGADASRVALDPLPLPKRHALCGKCMTPRICAEDGPGCAPAAGVGGTPDLHAAIMNLPSKWTPDDGDEQAYKRGHRDARHAAAELAAGVTAVQGPICENCKGSGMVHISIMGDGQDEPCKTCHGTGRLPVGVAPTEGDQR